MGTLAAPSLSGNLGLKDGVLWDRSIGLVLTQVQGRLVLAGSEVRLEGLTARAGPGNLALAGKAGVLAPGIPVDLRLTAKDASPLQLDRLKLQGDADLRLSGEALGRLSLAGRIQLSRVEIRLPERLPANVVTLEVREVGQRRAGAPQGSAASPWQPDLGLDLVLSAPRDLTVRGRGVDAELGGEVRLQGTLADPLISGGFDLAAGGVRPGGSDPAVLPGTPGFRRGRRAQPEPGSRGTRLCGREHRHPGRSGYRPGAAHRAAGRARDAPGRGPVASAVRGRRGTPVPLAGRPGRGGRCVPGGGGGRRVATLDRVRTGLGLERLSVGTDAQGGTILEGGRQVSERVYLGARQGTRAGEPQGVLRIEVTPRIQLEADVGPIGGTRAGAAFELEY